MSYEDRLRTAVYVAPSGSEHPFEFFELSRSREKKAAVNELPEREGADVQDLDQASLRLPITAFISGRNYDQSADAFWVALNERGPGTFRHPRWGNLTVLPVSIGQTEDFSVEGGRARFTIEFVQTEIAPAFPVSTRQREASVEQAINAYATAAAQALSDSVDVTDAAVKASAVEAFEEGLTDFTESAAPLAAEEPSLAERIRATTQQITSSIDNLLDEPRELALSVIDLYRQPARSVIAVWEKARGFAGLATQLINNVANAPTTQAIIALFQALTATGALAEATLTGTVERRDRAIASAEILKGTYDAVTTALEGREGAEFRMSQDALASLKAATSTAYSLLLERSFSLKIERRVLLDGDTTPLELAYRFYPSDDIDDALDRVIDENSLVDDEIWLVPRGREVVYYA
jgi:prophage DNA circulation protein